MVKTMTYFITKYSTLTGSQSKVLYRTENLEDWLIQIAKLKKNNEVKKNNCVWFKQTRSDDKEYTFLTIFENNESKRQWRKFPFTVKPDFIFYGYPEGADYV